MKTISHRPNIVKLLKINYVLKKQILKARGKGHCLGRTAVRLSNRNQGNQMTLQVLKILQLGEISLRNTNKCKEKLLLAIIHYKEKKIIQAKGKQILEEKKCRKELKWHIYWQT